MAPGFAPSPDTWYLVLLSQPGHTGSCHLTCHSAENRSGQFTAFAKDLAVESARCRALCAGRRTPGELRTCYAKGSDTCKWVKKLVGSECIFVVRAVVQKVQSRSGLVFTSQTVQTCKLRAETECDSLDRSIPQRFLHHTFQVDSLRCGIADSGVTGVSATDFAVKKSSHICRILVQVFTKPLESEPLLVILDKSENYSHLFPLALANEDLNLSSTLY